MEPAKDDRAFDIIKIIIEKKYNKVDILYKNR